VTTGVALRCEGLRKLYRTPAGLEIAALQDVSLSVGPGVRMALTGASGSGKSTLLHVIGAMDVVDSGRILVDGRDLASARERALVEYRRSIGVVFQRFHLLAALSALDNVIAPVLPYRTDFDKRTRALELLDRVGLADRASALPSRLSGGQQQRVAVARALINSPRLLLADEPTGNLDSATGASLLDLLVSLSDETGVTMILATHDDAVADRCQRSTHLQDGRVVRTRQCTEVEEDLQLDVDSPNRDVTDLAGPA